MKDNDIKYVIILIVAVITLCSLMTVYQMHIDHQERMAEIQAQCDSLEVYKEWFNQAVD